MFSIVGDWDLIKGKGRSISYWQFAENGSFSETSGKANSSTNKGTWEIRDDLVILKYENEDIGHAVLSFEDENKLVGENMHKNGSIYNMAFQRVDTQPEMLASKRLEMLNRLSS